MTSVDNKMDYNDAIAYLYGLQKHGVKLGLDNTIRLLGILGNPQDSFKSIHIAGTNGKGSTSAMIASMLQAANFGVGLFTSPHLVSFTERIKVNSVEISEAEVVNLTDEIRTAIQNSELRSASGGPNSELNPTFFEFVTAMAFLYFKRKGIDWAIVETGMGGRLDATNILIPRVSVLTKVSLDHKEFLGQTLRDITTEKAGIIKYGIPVVSSSQDREAMDIIMQKALEKKSNLYVYNQDFTAYLKNIGMQGIVFDYNGERRLPDLFVPLCGVHQLENASVAIRTVEVIMGEPDMPDSVRKGLSMTRWPGRLELVKMNQANYDILIDGAHNPSASEALAVALKGYFIPFYGKVILILGVMADKDAEGIMKPILPLASDVIFTAPDYERAASPSVLAGYAYSLGSDSSVAGSVKEAIDMAIRIANSELRSRNLILITGSFYTIGEAKIALGQRSTCPSLMGLR